MSAARVEGHAPTPTALAVGLFADPHYAVKPPWADRHYQDSLDKLRNAIDTLVMCTPARRATSAMVTRRFIAGCPGRAAGRRGGRACKFIVCGF